MWKAVFSFESTQYLIYTLIDWLIDWTLTRKPYKCTAPGYTPDPTNHKKDNGWQLHNTHKTIDAQNGGAVHKWHVPSSEEESYQARYYCPCKDTRKQQNETF